MLLLLDYLLVVEKNEFFLKGNYSQFLFNVFCINYKSLSASVKATYSNHSYGFQGNTTSENSLSKELTRTVRDFRLPGF